MTLIEMVVVMTIVGMLAVVLAAAFSVIVRANPSNGTRSDDSRTMLGLTTYLPEDINSTPSSGYDFSKSAVSGCTGTTDPGVSLVRLEWNELSVQYVANYRYEPSGGSYVIARYGCTGSSTAATRRVLTSGMPTIDESAWNPGDAPVIVTPIVEGGDTVGLTLEVTTIAGERFVVEGRTNNPSETLPPPPAGGSGGGPGSTNGAPVAFAVSVIVPTGGSSDIGLNASDPDGDPLVASLSNVIDTSASGTWTIALTDLVVAVTPPAGAADGESISFDYAVDDGRGGTASSSAVVTIGASPNNAPVAADATHTLNELATSTFQVAISDPEGDAMSVSIGTFDPSLTVNVGAVTGTTVEFIVTASGASVSPSFTYIVSDGALTTTRTVQLTVVKCATGTTSIFPATVDRNNGNGKTGQIKSAVTITVAYTGPCESRLTLEFQRDLRPSGTPNAPVVLSCASGSCSMQFAKNDGDWFPPGGSVGVDHTWTHVVKLDNSATVGTVNMKIKGT